MHRLNGEGRGIRAQEVEGVIRVKGERGERGKRGERVVSTRRLICTHCCPVGVTQSP